jgi:phage-related tail protein
MAYRSNQQLRENIWDYRDGASSAERENVLRFPRSDDEDHSETALDLVNQAAELFESMENHARETEAHAHSLCRSLAEKLQLSERQKDAAERARLETITELNRRLQDVTKALKHAERRIESAEDYATAAEFRAQAAENQLFKANRELAAVEEAIRTRLL